MIKTIKDFFKNKKTIIKYRLNSLYVEPQQAYSIAVETLNSEWNLILNDKEFLKNLKLLRNNKKNF